MSIRSLLVVTLMLSGCTEDTRPTGDASTDTSITVDSSSDSSSPDSSGGGSCGGATCGAGSVCCGPPECGFCIPEESGAFCGFGCDAGTADAGPPTSCNPGTPDTCAAGLGCECCGDIGPSPLCVCTTTCTSNADCTDPARSFCNLDPIGGMGVCVTPTFECCWGCD